MSELSRTIREVERLTAENERLHIQLEQTAATDLGRLLKLHREADRTLRTIAATRTRLNGRAPDWFIALRIVEEAQAYVVEANKKHINQDAVKKLIRTTEEPLAESTAGQGTDESPD